MASLGLTYAADAAEQGALVLDPRVDRLCTFKHLPAPPTLHGDGRAELAHQVSLLRVRAQAASAVDGDAADREPSLEPRSERKKKRVREAPLVVVAASVRKDFFGRVLPEPEQVRFRPRPLPVAD